MDDSIVIVLIIGIIVILIVLGIIISSHVHLYNMLQMKHRQPLRPRDYLVQRISPNLVPSGTPTSGTPGSNQIQATGSPTNAIPIRSNPVTSNPVTLPVGSTTSTSTTTALSPNTNVLLLGTVCPPNWTDIGEAGVLYPQHNLNSNPGFRLGASASPGYSWVHPRMCVGSKSKVVAKSGLFGLGNSSGAGPIGVLAPTSQLSQIPFVPGTSANPGWNWIQPNLVDAATPGVSDLVSSQDPIGRSTVGLLANSSSLPNLQNYGVTIGNEASSGWSWVYPKLTAA
jgi:hypothetical protein